MMSRSFLFFIIFLLGILCKYGFSQTTYRCSASGKCGCSAQSATLTKIVGGEAAASQTWGWMASLRRTSSGSHFCGGSIISSSHILTAAHCSVGFTSPSAIRVYVGSINLSMTAQVRDVSSIYIYPLYNSETQVNDISILKLSSPLNLNQIGVDIVCLPNVSSTVLGTEEYPARNTNLIAIGWGFKVQGSGEASNTLQQVTVQAVTAGSEYCGRKLVTDWRKQFCAGTMPQGGKDTCQGDSGGPLLMFTSDNVWEQVGITSGGIGCAQRYNPGVYTRVAAYQSWINETMNKASDLQSNAHTILIPIILLIWF